MLAFSWVGGVVGACVRYGADAWPIASAGALALDNRLLMSLRPAIAPVAAKDCSPANWTERMPAAAQ
jgi:hypothetical protein